MYSKEILNKIRDRISIGSFVGERVELKRAGRHLKGRCPFHNEKTPSFMVADDKQIFHCFGCGEGGDVFSFAMKYEGLNFYEAVKYLAGIAGVELPKDQSEEDRSKESENDRKKKLLFRVNEIARDYFISRLRDESAGAKARGYLQDRGIKEEICKQHFLGFADNSWDALCKHLSSRRVPLELAAELGLLKKNDRGGYYDFFRGRLMFPIISPRNEIIGFGGRVIEKGDDSAKYLNSPDSLIYHKSNSVYGLDQAVQAIRTADYALLVEGYMDLISLRQEGFANTVAPLGTALTEGHLRLLVRYTKNFVLIFDGDEAGERATVRSLELFIPSGIMPRVVRLPREDDPDSFVRKYGADAFREKIKSSVPLFEFFVSQVASGSRMDAVGKVGSVAKVVPFLKMMTGPVERGIYARMSAGRLGVDEGDLLKAIDGAKQIKAAQASPPKRAGAPASGVERTFISAILAAPSLAAEALEKTGTDVFRDEWLKNAAEAIASNISSRKTLSVGELLSNLGDSEQAKQLRAMALESQELDDAELKDLVFDCAEKLLARRTEEKIDGLNEEIARAEAKGDDERLFELLRQKQTLAQQRPGNQTRPQ